MKFYISYIILFFNFASILHAADTAVFVQEKAYDAEATEALLILMEDAITRNKEQALGIEEIAELCRKIRTLLDKGASPKTANRLNGSTALHFAAMGMELGLIEHLVRNGVDINVQVPNTLFTPLHYAAIQAHPSNNPSIEQVAKIKDTIALLLLLRANGLLKCSKKMCASEYITQWSNEGPYHGPVHNYLYRLECGRNLELLAEYVFEGRNSILMRTLLGRIFGSTEAFISCMQVRGLLVENGLPLELANYIFKFTCLLAFRVALAEEEIRYNSKKNNF